MVIRENVSEYFKEIKLQKLIYNYYTFKTVLLLPLPITNKLLFYFTPSI